MLIGICNVIFSKSYNKVISKKGKLKKWNEFCCWLNRSFILSQCSVSCDSGWQRRLVVCLSNNKHSERCDISLKPIETQQCNMPQCPSWTTGLWSQVSPYTSHTHQAPRQ